MKTKKPSSNTASSPSSFKDAYSTAPPPPPPQPSSAELMQANRYIPPPPQQQQQQQQQVLKSAPLPSTYANAYIPPTEGGASPPPQLQQQQFAQSYMPVNSKEVSIPFGSHPNAPPIVTSKNASSSSPPSKAPAVSTTSSTATATTTKRSSFAKPTSSGPKTSSSSTGTTGLSRPKVSSERDIVATKSYGAPTKEKKKVSGGLLSPASFGADKFVNSALQTVSRSAKPFIDGSMKVLEKANEKAMIQEKKRDFSASDNEDPDLDFKAKKSKKKKTASLWGAPAKKKEAKSSSSPVVEKEPTFKKGKKKAVAEKEEEVLPPPVATKQTKKKKKAPPPKKYEEDAYDSDSSAYESDASESPGAYSSDDENDSSDFSSDTREDMLKEAGRQLKYQQASSSSSKRTRKSAGVVDSLGQQGASSYANPYGSDKIRPSANLRANIKGGSLAKSMGQRGRSSSINGISNDFAEEKLARNDNDFSEDEDFVPQQQQQQQQQQLGGGLGKDLDLLLPPEQQQYSPPQWLKDLQTEFNVTLTTEWMKILSENEIDKDSFFLLSEKNLSELGLPLGARLKLLKVIQEDKHRRAMEVTSSFPYSSSAEGGYASTNVGDQQQQQQQISPSTGTTSTSSSQQLDELSQQVMDNLYLKFPRSLVVQPQDIEIFHDAQIGRGGFGTVTEGKLAGRPVAVKLFDDIDCGVEEALRTSSIFHKNIIAILGVTVCPHKGVRSTAATLALTPRPRLAMIMELAEGSLQQLLLSEKGSALDFDVVTRYAIQISQALSFLHQNRIIHADIKPGNCLLVNDLSTIKVCDFGISKQTKDKTRITMTHAIGSPIYMSPEQFVAGNQMDPSFDCYSFGAVMYYMISGREPFDGSLQAFMGADGKVQPLVELLKPRAGCPEHLIKICKDCLAVDPKQRPQNGDALFKMVVQGSESYAPKLVRGMMTQLSSGSSGGNNNNNSNSNTSSSSGNTMVIETTNSSSSGGVTEVIQFDNMTFG